MRPEALRRAARAVLAPAGLALALLAAGSAPGRAQSAFETVFRSGTLDALPPGAELRYADRESARGDAPSGDGTLALRLRAGDRAEVVAIGADGAETPRGGFDAGVGNPMAMVFLERTVARVAEATGGSPFYIRNRIRDALAAPAAPEPVTIPWEGGEVAGVAVTLAPFAADAHRAELGGFADLRLRVVMSEAVPGWYREIEATAPAAAGAPAYEARLSLVEEAPE